VDTPYGPHNISSQRQLSVPKAALDAVSLSAGDTVYFLVDEQHPRVLKIVPTEVIAVWLAEGRHVNPLAELRDGAASLDGL
jgi:hypothetical protein